MAKSEAPTFSELMKAFRKGEYAPIYLLHGEEDYFIDALADHIEAHALEESLRAFNQSVVYGRDVTGGQIRDMAGRLPMMAPRQVIIVREAQEMREISGLESYALKPVPTTLLVLCHKHKKPDGRTTFMQNMKKGPAVIFESKHLYEDKIPDWIRNWLKDAGHDITPEALALAHDYTGNHLSNVVNQLQKVVIGLPKGATVEIETVRGKMGISREYSVFELQKALGLRQKEKVYHILDQMMRNPGDNHPVFVVSMLGSYFIKLYTVHQLAGAKEEDLLRALGTSSYHAKEYRQVARSYHPPQLEKILGLLYEADLNSKGLGTRSTSESDLLKELCHRILAA